MREMPSWNLIDADEVAKENKYTFYKPPPEIIARVAPGENVKLIFAFESDDPNAPHAERMWVVVDKVLGNGRFEGRLDNDPKYIRDLKPDDPLTFEARHIINTAHDNDDNIVERYIKRCFVTKRVLYEGYPVGYLYREEPDEEKDSGWRITSNTESDEYMDDIENIAYVSLGAVLSKDDSFVDLLEQPSGSAFARNKQTGEFVPVTRES
jgi:hypothetical protein